MNTLNSSRIRCTSTCRSLAVFTCKWFLFNYYLDLTNYIYNLDNPATLKLSQFVSSVTLLDHCRAYLQHHVADFCGHNNVTIKPTTWHARQVGTKQSLDVHVGPLSGMLHTTNSYQLSKSHLRRVKELPLRNQTLSWKKQEMESSTTMEKHSQDTWRKKSKHPFSLPLI